MGRTATGVRGIALGEGDEVVGMEIIHPGATILTVTQNGYGKRTPLEDYRVQNRGGQGIINIRTSDRNGKVVGVVQVVEADDTMLITDGGKVLRCPAGGISSMGRATQGVRVMNLAEDENLVAISRLADSDDGVGDADDSAAADETDDSAPVDEADDSAAAAEADPQDPDGTDDAEA
jgi:DNA gyrase subunit A